ncbi:MAG TPA: phosphotransferase family protein [Candidatus Binataceae bacterium]|nr:phosphotransferase family protein [Candidatus Binataceae bacterium]
MSNDHDPSQPLPEFSDVTAEEQLDWNRLAAYLREHRVEGSELPLTVKQFRGGHSNLTYLLRFGDRIEWVVRRPPFGPLPAGGHDMAREYRVLSRIWEGFPQAPRAILFSDDTSIIGAPFFVMERKSGFTIPNRRPLDPRIDTAPATFRAMSEGFIDALADLHRVDYQALGLEGLGRPEGFLKRQITGWMDRWEKAKTDEVPLMNQLGAWFLDHLPEPQKPVLLHNDYYLHNVMFAPENNGRVVGVFDWEMSTLGDPMVDLGIALNYWRDPDDAPDLIALSEGHAHTTQPGFLKRDDLVELYARRTGRDVTWAPYYRAWALWKTATVVQQIYVRFVRGQTHDPRFGSMGVQPPVLARTAAEIVRRYGFRQG